GRKVTGVQTCALPIFDTEGEDISLNDSLKNLPHVESVDDPEEGAENDQLKNWSVTYSISPYDSEAVNGILDMKETAVKALEDAGVSDAEENVWVGGETATLYDTEEITSRDQAVIIPILLIIIATLLLIYLRSIFAMT